jgi:hypothetical protein
MPAASTSESGYDASNTESADRRVTLKRRGYSGSSAGADSNTIWQADAAAMSLQSLLDASCPPFVINIAGPELLSLRRIATDFAERFEKGLHFEGAESGDALLSSAQKAFQLFGYPTVSVDQMIAWIAKWTIRGGEAGKADSLRGTERQLFVREKATFGMESRAQQVTGRLTPRSSEPAKTERK